MTTATSSASSNSEPGESMARYEELRRGALVAGRSSRRHAYALFVHRGMAAWMQAWTEFLGTSSIEPQPGRSSAAVIPRALGSDVVVVLAGMALEREKAGDIT